MIKDYLKYIRNNPQQYWFKAKLYGWGWTPATWQGWLVMLVFIALIMLNAFRLDLYTQSESDTIFNFIPQTFILVIVLLIICWIKGEKPRWQWGPPKDKK